VTKVHSYNVAAFTAYGQGHLGQVDRNQVEVHQKPAHRESITVNGDLPKVELIKFPLGSDGILVDAAVAGGAKGLVLEGSGRGHIPPFAVESVEKAVRQGVRVVLTTSCEEPRVYPVYDFAGGVMDLNSRGVIMGGNYQPKKARIKLALLLGAGITDPVRLQKSFLN
jgi:L-asparaginase